MDLKLARVEDAQSVGGSHRLRINDYVRLTVRYQIARGQMAIVREDSDVLCKNLAASLEAPLVQLVGEVRADDPPEGMRGLFYLDLATWMTGSEISDAIRDLRAARAALEEAWQALSDDERSAAKPPDEI
jgi:hypothetical protein